MRFEPTKNCAYSHVPDWQSGSLDQTRSLSRRRSTSGLILSKAFRICHEIQGRLLAVVVEMRQGSQAMPQAKNRAIDALL